MDIPLIFGPNRWKTKGMGIICEGENKTRQYDAKCRAREGEGTTHKDSDECEDARAPIGAELRVVPPVDEHGDRTTCDSRQERLCGHGGRGEFGETVDDLEKNKVGT